MSVVETAILAKAAALGATLPRYRMADAPGPFAQWSDRIAQADSLRHAGRPFADAVAEADEYLGIRKTRLAIGVLPALVPDRLGLGWLAAAIGADAPARVAAQG